MLLSLPLLLSSPWGRPKRHSVPPTPPAGIMPVAKNCSRAHQNLPKSASERLFDTNPQHERFQPPPGEAQVSSRLDGSSVFTVCPGPLLASILTPFWHHFGSHGLYYFFLNAPALPGRAQSEPLSGSPEPFGAAVEPFLVTLIASAPPKSRSGLQNTPRGLQNRSKRVSKRVENRCGVALIVAIWARC